ncbi:5'-nucleotidase, lipoprotein e(P4) family [Brevibacillus ginsengisoli]|uniref:5'-nucleotidase, lipoprotein e(P4) family n=1 Tax=Brevibacillus ginsengisoli TaxID=363854 RepID=UPI003CEB4D50
MLKRTTALLVGISLLAPSSIFAATAPAKPATPVAPVKSTAPVKAPAKAVVPAKTVAPVKKATPAIPAKPATPAATVVPAEVKSQPSELTKEFVMADAWYQTAGEARALYYQAFTLADMMLDKDLADKSITQKRAVIVDIDETILDNSPHNVLMLQQGKEFNPVTWNEWVNLAEAKAVPGSVEFLNKAVKSGADVYYISNRSVDQIQATIKNLKAAGFPQAEESHMLFKDKVSSKEERRQQVAKDHHIALLMGDNLVDFASVFEAKPVAERNKAVDEMKDKFGKYFIVLPNPMYGDWESALYNFNNKLTPEQKLEARHSALTPYKSDIK